MKNNSTTTTTAFGLRKNNLPYRDYNNDNDHNNIKNSKNNSSADTNDVEDAFASRLLSLDLRSNSLSRLDRSVLYKNWI